MASAALPIRFNELLQVTAFSLFMLKHSLICSILQLTDKDIDVRLQTSLMNNWAQLTAEKVQIHRLQFLCKLNTPLKTMA